MSIEVVSIVVDKAIQYEMSKNSLKITISQMKNIYLLLFNAQNSQNVIDDHWAIYSFLKIPLVIFCNKYSNIKKSAYTHTDRTHEVQFYELNAALEKPKSYI